MEDNIRPWGFFETLSDSETHKIKRITVFPGKRLSLQKHLKRSEHWFLVHGNAVVTCGKKLITLSDGDHVNIGECQEHRIENIGNEDLVFIEIQTGSYFGEDDIIRIEDDFGRV